MQASARLGSELGRDQKIVHVRIVLGATLE
jgi:hypothetical protein